MMINSQQHPKNPTSPWDKLKKKCTGTKAKKDTELPDSQKKPGGILGGLSSLLHKSKIAISNSAPPQTKTSQLNVVTQSPAPNHETVSKNIATESQYQSSKNGEGNSELESSKVVESKSAGTLQNASVPACNLPPKSVINEIVKNYQSAVSNSAATYQQQTISHSTPSKTVLREIPLGDVPNINRQSKASTNTNSAEVVNRENLVEEPHDPENEYPIRDR
jgi:hypothetical protein